MLVMRRLMLLLEISVSSPAKEFFVPMVGPLRSSLKLAEITKSYYACAAKMFEYQY